MEDDTAQASEPQQGLINPVPMDEDAAYAIAASQAGVDMNNPQAVEQWMETCCEQSATTTSA